MNLNDVAIVSIKGSDYRIHFWYMSKDDAIIIMKNLILKKCIDIKFFCYVQKMSETTHYERIIKRESKKLSEEEKI